MDRSQFREGQLWAYRRSRRLGEEAAKVRLVAYPPGARKVKVVHVEGELEGLDEWVPPTSLLVPWKQWPKRRRAEQQQLRLREHVTEVGLPDAATAAAIDHVLAASGEDEMWLRERYGILEGPEEAFERLMSRAGFNDEQRAHLVMPPAIRDAGSRYWYLPWDQALALVIAFAQAEPDVVALFIDDEQRDLKERGYLAGERWAHDYLRTKLPGFALAREWTDRHDEHVKVLERRLRDLERLLDEAANALETAGDERLAGRLRRALKPGR